MSEKIEPALTTEEWKWALKSDSYMSNGGFSTWLTANMPTAHGEYSAHEIAALALYGQLFGFTREEANHLRYVAEQTDWKGLQSIVEKIEALLPPEKP